MAIFSYFEITTGEILGTVVADNDMERFWILDYPNWALVPGLIMGATHYVADGVVTERPRGQSFIDKLTITANGLDTTTIPNLPNPSVVMVDDQTFDVTDGVFEFTVDTPGTYQIKVESFPYLPKTYEVVAT